MREIRRGGVHKFKYTTGILLAYAARIGGAHVSPVVKGRSGSTTPWLPYLMLT